MPVKTAGKTVTAQVAAVVTKLMEMETTREPALRERLQGKLERLLSQVPEARLAVLLTALGTARTATGA